MKFDFKKLFETAADYVEDHLGDILFYTGLIGMGGCAISTGYATYDAMVTLNEKEVVEHKDHLTTKEVVQATWKCYIPAVLLGLTSAGCLLYSNKLHNDTNTALLAAYNISEKTAQAYRDKVIASIGDQKEKAVRDEVAKDLVESKPASKSRIIETGNGKDLFYDPVSDRYFRSNIESIRKAVNDVNEHMIVDMTAPLNDLYYSINLREVKYGNNLGWDINEGQLVMRFSSQISDTGEPCVVLDYDILPRFALEGF